METTLSQERKSVLSKGNHDSLSIILLIILTLAVRVVFADGLVVSYSSLDIKTLKKWDASCDQYNYVNWNTEADPGNFVGITWDNSNPKRVIKVILESYDFYNAVDLNELPMLSEVNFGSCRLSSVSVANHTKIQNLTVAGNRLTSLDVTGCIALKKLQCQANSLTSLTLGNASALQDIYCQINQLTEIIFPSGASVKNLDISQNKLPMSKMPIPSASFTSYQYSDQLPVFESSTQWLGYTINYSSEATINGKATSFSWFKNGVQIFGASGSSYKPVSGGSYSCKMTNTKFPWLTIETEPITIRVDPDDTNGDGYHDGDVASLNQLRSLYSHIASSWPEGQHASWSGVTWDESFPKRVSRLNLMNKNIQGTLNLSAFSNLELLAAGNNYFSGLTISGLTKLKTVNITEGVLQTLNISGLTALEEVRCNDNHITQITTSNNNSLKWIYFNNNQVSSFNATSLPALIAIECKSNQLTALDLSANSHIHTVMCNNNQLQSLAFHPNIYQLYCCNNLLSSLNLANCNKMEILDINNNSFSIIDVSGATILKSFTASWNRLMFSRMPDPSRFWDYDFDNQTQIMSGSNEEVGFIIDLSSETTILGIPTVFVWKKNGEVIQGAIVSSLNTADYGIGDYTCEMTNEKFPGVKVSTGKITITKKEQLITGPTEYEFVYGQGKVHLENTASSGLPLEYIFWDPATCTFEGDSMIITGTGGFEITAYQAGNDEYEPADLNILISIYRADEPILGIEDIETQYGKGPFTINAYTPHGLPVTLSTNHSDKVRIEGNKVYLTGLGNAVIDAFHDGDNRYNRKRESFYVKITKGDDPILGVDDMTFTYGDAPKELHPYTSQGFPVIIHSLLPSSFSIDSNTLTINGAGSGQLSFTHLGNEYYNAQMKTVNVTVNKATQTGFSFTNLERAVGDPAIQLPAVSDQGFPFSYSSSNTSVATVRGNEILIVGQGECTIQASNQGNYNYNPVDERFTLTVSVHPKQVQTISNFDDMNILSTTPSFDLDAIASSGLSIVYTASNNCIEIEEDKAMVLDSGTVFITARQEGNDTYSAVEKTIQVRINRESQHISQLNNILKTINDGKFNLIGLATSGLQISYSSSKPEVASIEGDEVTIHSIGETTIVATQEGNWQYHPTSTQIKLTISENSKLADEIFGPQKLDFIYGIQSMKVNLGSSSGMPVMGRSSDESVVSITGNDLIVKNAGSCTIHFFTNGNDIYLPAEKDVEVIVAKANQFILEYGTVNLKLGYTSYTLSAHASSGEPVEYFSIDESIASVLGNVVTPVHAGVTQLIAFQSGTRNYNSVADTVEVIVAPRDLLMQTITGLNDLVKSKKDEPFELTGNSSSGLALTYTSSNRDVATIENNRVTIVGSGITMLTAIQPGNDEFASASMSVQLLVLDGNKLTQTVDELTDITATFGDTEIKLPLKTSAGLEITYTVADTKVAYVSGNLLKILQVGETYIYATQGGNDLFEPFSWKGVCVVTKAKQMISGLNDLKLNINDQTIELNGESNSGLTVSYQSSDPKIASIEGNKLRIHTVGEVIVTASQLGNSNYLPAADVTFKVVVTTTNGIDRDEEFKIQVYPNPSTGILNFNLIGAGKVSVYDMNGKLVFDEDFGNQLHHQINVQQLRTGVYHFVVTQPGKRFVSRVVLN